MVPSGNLVVNIGIVPLLGGEIEDDHVVIVELGVPSTIGVELIVVDENGVTTTTWGQRLQSLDGFDALPDAALNIVSVDIIEGDTCVVKTTVSSIDEDLVLVDAGAGVGTRRGTANGRLLVVLDALVTGGASPDVLLGVQEPRVVKSDGRTSMSTEHEQLFVLGSNGDRDVLGTGGRDFVAFGFLALPDPVLAGHSEGEEIRVGADFLSCAGHLNTTVHQVRLTANEIHRMTRARCGLFTLRLLTLPN